MVACVVPLAIAMASVVIYVAHSSRAQRAQCTHCVPL